MAQVDSNLCKEEDRAHWRVAESLSQCILNAVTGFISHVQDSIFKDQIWTDGYMLLTDDKAIYNKLTAFFDLLHFDFTTGEPDQPEDHYYLDFTYHFGPI